MLRYFFAASLLLFSSLGHSDECRLKANAVLGILDFEIEGCKVKGDLLHSADYVYGEFMVDLTKLSTGLDLRDDHMKNKYLEVEKFPMAHMKIEKIPLNAKTFEGILTLHGKSKTVKGEVLEIAKDKLKVNFLVKITDFSIEKPGYKKIVIGEDIELFVSVP